MLNYFQVSVVLLIVWGAAFLILRKKLYSSKGYFLLLFVMAVAGIVLPLEEMLDLDCKPSFSFLYTILFALLLLSAIIPWLDFEKYLKTIKCLKINPSCLPILRIVIIVLTVLSTFAIIYTLPYAIVAYKMGAADIRWFIRDQSLLPKSPLTTVAVGVGLIAPVYIFFFFLSLLAPELHRYSKYLFVGSLTYLVTSAAFQARDGFVFIPITYFFLFQVFKKSLPKSSKEYLKRAFKLVLPILLTGILVISFDRFFEKGASDAYKSLIGGTWGYVYQQPYVFDVTLQHTQHFQGLGHRFELISVIFNLPYSTDYAPYYQFEWMFGTMYGSFYSASGWPSLLIASIFFSLSWLIVLHGLYRNNNHMGSLLVFSLYLYFLISGLFYFRFSAMNITIIYLVLIIASFFLKNYILMDYN